MRATTLTMLLALALGACAISEQLPGPPPPPRLPPLPGLPDLSPDAIAGPEPRAYRYIVANSVKEILGNPERAGALQISGLRRFPSLKGPAWLVCIKTQHFPMLRHYAVVIQRNRFVDSRLSVVLDHCELQTYAAFDWAAEAVNPPAP